MLEILRNQMVPLAGARAVVVGGSVVVGKPAALLLLAENATVMRHVTQAAARCLA